MGRLVMLSAALAWLTGCSCTDEPRVTTAERMRTQRDGQFTNTMRTTETGGWGATSVSERTKTWNQQSDGSWKHAGETRRGR